MFSHSTVGWVSESDTVREIKLKSGWRSWRVCVRAILYYYSGRVELDQVVYMFSIITRMPRRLYWFVNWLLSYKCVRLPGLMCNSFVCVCIEWDGGWRVMLVKVLPPFLINWRFQVWLSFSVSKVYPMLYFTSKALYFSFSFLSIHKITRPVL